jgi:hypothetical protein
VYCSSHAPPLRGADDTSSTGIGIDSLPITPRPALQRSSDSADGDSGGGSGGGSDGGSQPGTPDQAPTRSSSVAVGDAGGIARARGNASGSASAGGNSGGGSDGSSQPDTPEQARQRSDSAAAEDGGGLSSSSGSKPNDCANPAPKLVGGRGSRGCVGTTTKGKPCRSKSDSYGGYCKPHAMQVDAYSSDSNSCRSGNLRCVLHVCTFHTALLPWGILLAPLILVLNAVPCCSACVQGKDRELEAVAGPCRADEV